MTPSWITIKFYEVQFDENWQVNSTTNLLFTYNARDKEC